MSNVEHGKLDSKRDENDSSNAESCAICLLEITDPKESCRLEKCKHLFHPSCIHPWVRDLKHKACPLCRSGGKLICCSKDADKTRISNACKRLNAQRSMRSIIVSPLHKKKNRSKEKKKKVINVNKRLDSIIMYMEDPQSLFREEV